MKRDLEALSNDALLSRIHEAAQETKRRLVAEIVMLMEVEWRSLHLEMAYSSMYEFCYREMHLSEDQAYRYVNAARMAKMFPEILDDLESGKLHLASLALLKKHVRTESDDWLLDVARGKSKREVERELAKHFPKDDEPRERIQPLSESRAQLEVTVSTTTVEKIQYAKELMSHSNPSQSIEVVLDVALDVLIAKLEKSRQAKADRPRPANESKKGITRSVRREVSERDGGQCTFVSKAGDRCTSKTFLELDHAIPRAWNGPNTPANVREMCRAHNQYEARRLLGDERVDRAIESKRSEHEREHERESEAEREHEHEPDPARAGKVEHVLDERVNGAIESKRSESEREREPNQNPNPARAGKGEHVLDDERVNGEIESKRSEREPNQNPNPARAGKREHLLDALVKMGFKKAHAQRMMDEERASNPNEESDGIFLRNVLRRMN